MNSILLISLLVVVALIAGFALVQQAGRSPKRRMRKAYHPEKRIAKKRDYRADIAKRNGCERSPQWQRVRKEHLLREPACAVCGHKGRKLQVHHIKPFHLHPQLELDPRNLITLCEVRGREHHLLLGHLNTWESYNEHIRDDAKRFYRKTAAQIRADSVWQKKVVQRP